MRRRSHGVRISTWLVRWRRSLCMCAIGSYSLVMMLVMMVVAMMAIISWGDCWLWYSSCWRRYWWWSHRRCTLLVHHIDTRSQACFLYTAKLLQQIDLHHFVSKVVTYAIAPISFFSTRLLLPNNLDTGQMIEQSLLQSNRDNYMKRSMEWQEIIIILHWLGVGIIWCI